MAEFNYMLASEEEILQRASALEGARLGDIPGVRFEATGPVYGKGEAGLAVEAYFGIPPNSAAEADFPAAGIELKIAPLVRSGKGLRMKERTVIGMIDYHRLVEEEWPTASVRKKLKILFVFIEHLPDRPKKDFPIRAITLWEPDEGQKAIIRADWERVRDKVAAGFAHELSEGDGLLLGPCTKGAHSRVRVAQPTTLYSPDAKPRAFALKPAFTFSIYEGVAKRRSRGRVLSPRRDPIEQITARLDTLRGRKIGEIAAELDVPLSGSKSFAAGVIHRALGAQDARSAVKELEEIGVSIKTTRLKTADGYPYEAMSFPYFRYMELIEEGWEDSTLLSQLEGLLVVPFRGRQKSTPPEDCVLGRPFLWRPSADELEVAEAEWTMFRDLIAEGKALELPGSSQTQMLHVRPHARDKDDTDLAPVVGPVVKKSFWLNHRFIAQLVERYS